MQDEYIPPDPTAFEIYNSHSTGSSMDGTRRHHWRARSFQGGYSRNVGEKYKTEEAAWKAADDYTLRSVEP